MNADVSNNVNPAAGGAVVRQAVGVPEETGVRLADNMISVRDLCKVYHMGDVEVQALCGVSFDIRRGEFIAIIGHSGSGKSTLMNLLGCLDTPTEGEYSLDGVETQSLSDDDLAFVRSTRLGFVFQQYNLLPRQTALRNVEMPLIYRGVPAGERRARAETALRMVGMGDRMHHRPSQLSGGQQQRVAIARSLVGSPAVILADEPTGALDTRTSVEIMDILTALNRQQGLTVVVVTHEADIAAYANRVLTLRDGQLVSDGKKPAGLAAQGAEGGSR
jgi:putative ABC transport system ATP-binding protein